MGGLKGHVGHPAPQQPRSHEVLDCNTTIVAVAVDSEATCADSGSFCKGVRDHAVAGLESDFWLEGVLSNCTNHLKRNVWAVE